MNDAAAPLPLYRVAVWLCVSAPIWCAAAECRAQWLDPAWQFRRAVDVMWDSDHAAGRELATVDILTAGHETPACDGSDVRVTTQDGGIVPSHVLGVGPGDVIHLVFALTPDQLHYFVYFDNPAAPPPPPGTDDVQYHCGILLQMKQWPGEWPRNTPHNAQDLVDQWDNAGPIIGQTMIPQPFYTDDPLGDQPRRIYKLTGSLIVPQTTNYFFTASAQGYAALFLDGQPALTIPGMTRAERFHANVPLHYGRHDFVMYYVRPLSHEQLALDWRRLDTNKLEPVPRTAFGIVGHGIAGALQQYGKTLIADFDVQYEGEAALDDNDNYSHRYQFTARTPSGLAADAAANLKFDWDFGDGITAGGTTLEHVYITPGIYPVKLTVRTEGASDMQTTRLDVHRDWSDGLPPQDTTLRQGRVVARYDVSQVPEPWLSWMVLMERDAQLTDAEMAAAARIVELERHVHPDAALASLKQISDDLTAAGKVDEAANMWEHVPAHSDLQPMAAATEADELIWWLADFPRALKATERVADSTDPLARSAYAQALVLNGRADDGEKILTDLQDHQEQSGVHLAAVSGAMARTIEYRVDQKDWQSGEDEWRTWQARCPLVFMDGYSVLLRTDMMEERGATAAAAKVDEAFADAVQNSPYAPQLLDHAATLLARTAPAKSRQLRDLLKTRYPEDPLSQK